MRKGYICGASKCRRSHQQFSEKSWIEASFPCFLVSSESEYFLSHRTILPEQSFFPDKYRGTEECLRNVVARVCSYMDVDFNKIEIDIYSEGEASATKDDWRKRFKHGTAADFKIIQ